MKREKAKKLLARITMQISELEERKKEVEEILREAEKEEAAYIMGKYKISVDELQILLKEHEAENRKLLEEKRKEMEHEAEKKDAYQNKTDTDC